MLRSTFLLTVLIFTLCQHDIEATAADEGESCSVHKLMQWTFAAGSQPELDEPVKQNDESGYAEREVHQDLRLIASFALGIGFMYVLEVLKGNAPAGRRNSKFELYPYVL
eukprot:TRINITY_DN109696_c0_g1_i1.p1 TRINITY_DN109696_c0_g1~~TRINITY_DN109696_c0_g1_i1.p1  ORF type:complete len:110 (+),score=20.40 TRINITY_DN109696_c0_g1_i1:139-468(+)